LGRVAATSSSHKRLLAVTLAVVVLTSVAAVIFLRPPAILPYVQIKVDVNQGQSKWGRNPSTDLPQCSATVTYRIHNEGNIAAQDTRVTVQVDDSAAKDYRVSVSPKGYHSGSVDFTFRYDTRHEVAVSAISGDSSDRRTLIPDTTLPRSPYLDPDTVKLFVTPGDSVVRSTLNNILRSYPLVPHWIAIRDWVSNNVRYVGDPEAYGCPDYAQLSRETLDRKTGDCEDFSILLASLLRADGYGQDRVLVVLGKKGENYHAWVRLKVDVIGWQNIEPQAGGLATIIGDQMILSGYTAMYCFNDAYYGEAPSVLQVTKGRLAVLDATWVVSGNQVYVASVGEVILTKVTVKALEGRVSGNLAIRVRKDVPFSPDIDHAGQSYIVSIEVGETRGFSLSWIPDKPSGPSLRGYFLRILLEDVNIWTMQDSYPPRLSVKEPAKGRIVVSAIVWYVYGQSVYVAKLGDTVDTRVTVRAEDYRVSGLLTVKIRKDVPSGADTDYREQSYNLDLEAGYSRELSLTWQPDTATSTNLRGYFVKVLFNNAEVYSMPSSYPPRLRVEPPRIGTPQVVDAFWTIGSARVIQASVGQVVYAHVVITAVGGSVEGDITIKVKKDRVATEDTDFIVRSFHIALQEGQSMDYAISFIPDQKSSVTFRGLFIHVDLLSWRTNWTMPSSYPPRLKVV